MSEKPETLFRFETVKSLLLYFESTDADICAIVLLTSADKTEDLIMLLKSDHVSEKAKLLICEHFIRKNKVTPIDTDLNNLVTHILCQLAKKEKVAVPPSSPPQNTMNKNDTKQKVEQKVDLSTICKIDHFTRMLGSSFNMKVEHFEDEVIMASGNFCIVVNKNTARYQIWPKGTLKESLSKEPEYKFDNFDDVFARIKEVYLMYKN